MGTAARAWILLPMECATYDCRLAPLVFHDVDFAAERPLNLVGVHPKRGPHSLRRWQIDAGFEATGSVQRIRRDQSGLILLRPSQLIDRSDLQVAAGHSYLPRP